MKYENKPFFYKRFIDDGFGIWLGSTKALEKFADYANSIHRNIKIELRWDAHKIEFLDTSVKLKGGVIFTDLYKKPTDKQLYIQSNSCHPNQTKKALAYGLGLRLKRICKKEEDYTKHRKQLKHQLRKRGYSGHHIENQLQRVDKLDREKLLRPERKEQDVFVKH